MDKLKRNSALVSFFVIAAFSGLFGRLFYLQVLNYQQLGSISTTNSIRRVWAKPPRGRIIDRTGTIIVDNQPLYTVKIIPSEFDKKRIGYLAWLIQRPKEEVAEMIRKGYEFNRFSAVTVCRNLEAVTVARVSENLWQLPGVIIDTENKRMYLDSLYGAHLFGYVRSISKEKLEELADLGYTQDDKIGFSGLEKFYEDRLRGQKGARFEMVTPLGKYAGKFDNGKSDIAAIKGDDLYLAIDGGLQHLAEKLMRKTGKSGAVVAIDPSTGGILALVSAPDYDLDIFNGATDRKGWNDIITSPQKPLFNRTVQAVYPPGSVYKMILAMAALEEKKMDPKKKILDNGVFIYGKRRFLSNEGKGHGWVDMREAITVSSNVYFYNLIFNVGFDNWTKYGSMFGFGEKTGIDLPGERAGLLPSADYYNKKLGRHKWTKGYLVSLSIGQGELGTTPVQLAAYAAAIANNGTLFQPHIVNGYRDTGTGKYIPFAYDKQQLPVSASTFSLIKEGMTGVVQRGTGTLAQVQGVTVAGKTGTAQNPHGKDHAWFIAFAPVENPKIAMAVLVENAGFGGAISAPIARELIKYYVKGERLPVVTAKKGITPSTENSSQPDSTEKTPATQPETIMNSATEPPSENTSESNTGNVPE
ncbi:MAG: penicillin-binding protein 2 [Chlorobiaceae bacterium]|nr:penicillin-binding protein 2 [Chlorobiaceae bacterium]NTV15939.1 penicillin-binding protein 2 [Chlorobiaceae bacterium]